MKLKVKKTWGGFQCEGKTNVDKRGWAMISAGRERG